MNKTPTLKNQIMMTGRLLARYHYIYEVCPDAYYAKTNKFVYSKINRDKVVGFDISYYDHQKYNREINVNPYAIFGKEKIYTTSNGWRIVLLNSAAFIINTPEFRKLEKCHIIFKDVLTALARKYVNDNYNLIYGINDSKHTDKDVKRYRNLINKYAILY